MAENPKAKGNALGCSREVRDLPATAYALSGDGRKRKHLCAQRQCLALILATFADADGTSIKVGIERLMKLTGWSHGTVCTRLDDLRRLGMLTLQGYTEYHGTRERTIDLRWVRGAKWIAIKYDGKMTVGPVEVQTPESRAKFRRLMEIIVGK